MTGGARRSVALVAVGVATLTLIAALVSRGRVKPAASPAEEAARATAAEPITFNKDVAPIVYARCAGCHRPGESGPFSLLTYQDVKGRASLVAEVTGARYMPPWLPEHGTESFADERRLSDVQIETLARWVEQGTIEGDPKDRPPPPTWTEGWRLGEPDLVVEMPDAYTLPAKGTDDFRNFVLPLSLPEDRFVRAIEVRPGNPKIVHHAVVLVDRGRAARMKDSQDPGPGFAGMDQGEEIGSPEGQFIGWTPGKTPFMAPESMSWRLEKNADLVLMLHLVPSGKPEVIKSKLGLFFSRARPTREPVLLRLGSKTIDIPAERSSYVVEDSMLLPVDTELVGVYPHAHYLGKEMSASAVLPSGETRELLHIKAWDFNWQDEYRYARPVTLPKDTLIRMRFTYDNSSTNPRNPHRPAKQVLWGPRSRDEMGYLWLQAVPRDPVDLPALRRASSTKKFFTEVEGFRHAVTVNPDDAQAQNNLGVALNMLRKPGEAAEHLELAARLAPKYVAAQFNLGVLLLDRGERRRAREQFARTLRLAPDHTGAHVNLGSLMLIDNELAPAAEHFERALAVKSDPEAHFNLGTVRMKQGRLREAEEHFAATVAALPDDTRAKELLATVRQQLTQSPR